MAEGVGIRVRERRVAAGATQAQLAEALALDTSAVSRIERGERHLSAFELGLLADTFGWDPRDLLGMERPRNKLAVAARLREADGSAEHALTRLADLVEVDALLDEAGVGHASSGLSNLDLRPVPRDEAAADQEGSESAERLREKVSAHDGISDLIGFAEVVLGVDVLVADLPGGCDGAVAIGEQVAVAAVDAKTVSGRQRFTLAHEIGHALMGDVIDTVHIDNGSSDPLVELRAHSFAANLLMPPDAVRRILGARPGPAELVEAMVAFGVSWTALRRHCEKLDIELQDQLRRATGEELFTLAGRKAEEPRVSAPTPPRIPSRLDRRVREAYTHALIGAGVVGMAFGVRGETLDNQLAEMPLEFELPAPSKSGLA